MTFEARHLCSFAIDVGEAQTVDQGAPLRRFVPILGGVVSNGLTGRILSGGGDWQSVLVDGTIEISAHYVIEIEGEGLVEIRSDGVRAVPEDNPDAVYFRTLIRFQTSAPGLKRLNKVLAISTGRREANRVLLEISEIL